MLLLKSRGANFITMSDAYCANYSFNDINIIIDHHIDFYPAETEIIARWELENDIRSSIYLFNQIKHPKGSRRGQNDWKLEDLNIPFYKELEQNGFEIGYHSNCVGQAQLQLGIRLDRGILNLPAEVFKLASDIFTEDIANLKKHFDIKTFIPHGAGENNNILSPLPDGSEDLIWAYNNHRKYGNCEKLPKWRNFSDSNLDLPQIFGLQSGHILSYIDNLYLFCASARQGLHHLVLHAGRYSRGMPYDSYSGPTPLNNEQVETNCDWDVARFRPPFASNGPLSLSKNREGQDQQEFQRRYFLTNCEVFLADAIKLDPRSIATFLISERLTKEEKASLKINRANMASSFKLPTHNLPALEDYRSFTNTIYSSQPLETITSLDVHFKSVYLKEIMSQRFSDIDSISMMLERVYAMDGYLFIELIINNDIYAKYKRKFVRRLKMSPEIYSKLKFSPYYDDVNNLTKLELTYSL